MIILHFAKWGNAIYNRRLHVFDYISDIFSSIDIDKRFAFYFVFAASTSSLIS
jgi:hypothetical protein